MDEVNPIVTGVDYLSSPTWTCKMHGDQGYDSGLTVLGDSYCSQCIKDLFEKNMYPMKRSEDVIQLDPISVDTNTATTVPSDIPVSWTQTLDEPYCPGFVG